MRIDSRKTNTRKLLFGMAFTWSLFFVAPIFQDTYISLDGIYARGNLCLNLAAAITAAILLAFLRRGRKIHSGVLQAGGILFAAGNVMNYLSTSIALLPLGFLYLSSFLEGIGLVCILSVWASKLSSLQGRSLCVVLVGSYLLGAVILTVVVLVDRMANIQPLWLVYVCAAGILSTPRLWVGKQRDSLGQETMLKNLATPYLIPFFFEVVLFLMGFVFTSTHTVISQANVMHSSPFGLIPPVICLAIISVAFFKTKNTQKTSFFVMKIALFAVVLGLLVIMIFGYSFSLAAGVFVLSGYYCFVPGCCIILAYLANSHRTNFLYTFVNGMFFLYGGSALAKAFLMSPLYESMLVLGSGIAFDFSQAIVLLLAIVLIGVGFFVLSENRPNLSTTSVSQSAASEESVQTRIAALEQECSLTKRQVEVLTLLAEGMSAAEVQEALCISNATVRAHIRSIYEKLDVHSQGDLMRKLFR